MSQGRQRLDRVGNLLGALSLSVADRTSDAVGDAAGQSETAAIALSALHQFLNRPSVGLLRQVLGLTPSGTVRLLDRLQDAGYVTRRPGRDGRSVSVHLTAAGRRAAERVAGARAEVLDEALSPLSPAEREAFQRGASVRHRPARGVRGCALEGPPRPHPRTGRHPLDVPSVRHDGLRAG